MVTRTGIDIYFPKYVLAVRNCIDILFITG